MGRWLDRVVVLGGLAALAACIEVAPRSSVPFQEARERQVRYAAEVTLAVKEERRDAVSEAAVNGRARAAADARDLGRRACPAGRAPHLPRRRSAQLGAPPPDLRRRPSHDLAAAAVPAGRASASARCRSSGWRRRCCSTARSRRRRRPWGRTRGTRRALSLPALFRPRQHRHRRGGAARPRGRGRQRADGPAGAHHRRRARRPLGRRRLQPAPLAAPRRRRGRRADPRRRAGRADRDHARSASGRRRSGPPTASRTGTTAGSRSPSSSFSPGGRPGQPLEEPRRRLDVAPQRSVTPPGRAIQVPTLDCATRSSDTAAAAPARVCQP